MSTVTFGDTLAAVIGLLDTALSVPVVSRVPNPRPASFVRATRVGGPRRNIVTDEATIAVEAWAADEAAAHDLLQSARATIHASLGVVVPSAGHICRTAELAGPAHSPDPESGHERYVMTFAVAFRPS